MAVKLDISKVYDRVEWEFLERIMLRLGFPEQWVHLAMLTVRSVVYLVLIDSEPQGYITPSRGIKQGDPLSSYLFLFCAEGLSSLLKKATDAQYMKGLLSCHGGVRISHLMFADDCLLFCEAKIEECRQLLNLLAQYEQASGQAIDKQKIMLLFSRNTCRET